MLGRGKMTKIGIKKIAAYRPHSGLMSTIYAAITAIHPAISQSGCTKHERMPNGKPRMNAAPLRPVAPSGATYDRS